MIKLFKWLYANKITLTGFLALIFYVLDEIFDFSGSMDISQEAYYGIASLIFIIVGFAIKGRGIESIDHFKEAIEMQKKLKESKTLQEKVEILSNIIDDDQPKDK
ncbi:hypothetical protein KHQ81_09300 [Mycoplasmatota bacterium]|nr:hypothetical protein KHQ81_09300 [Mycoplasmatota bacterium]